MNGAMNAPSAREIPRNAIVRLRAWNVITTSLLPPTAHEHLQALHLLFLVAYKKSERPYRTTMASIARIGLLRQAQFISGKRMVPSVSSFRPTSTILSRSQFVSKIPVTTRIAPFSTTLQKKIFPPGPQVIRGGVNDPAPVPKPSPVHGSYHWTAERLISIGLIPLTIAPFAGSSMNPTLDAVFVAAILVHSHIGFQACIVDYFPNYSMPGWRKIMDWVLNIATVLVAIGFYEYETNDVGLCEGLKRIWHAGANDATIGKVDISALGHDGKLKHLKN
ncbi:hypothetical protein R6Q59_010200 [Mikania micrantha]